MASLMYDLLPEYPDCELEIIPGITCAIGTVQLFWSAY